MTTELKPKVEIDRIIWRQELASLCKVQTKTIGKWVKEQRIPAPDTRISARTMGWKQSTLRNAGVAV